MSRDCLCVSVAADGRLSLFVSSRCFIYEIRLIAIREVSPPFGEEHRGLEQDISFPANNNLLILGKCYAVHVNTSSL